MQWAIITAWFRCSSERLPIIAMDTSVSVHRPAPPSAPVAGTIAGGRARRNLACDYFPLAARRPFLARQNNRRLRPSAVLRPQAVHRARLPASHRAIEADWRPETARRL